MHSHEMAEKKYILSPITPKYVNNVIYTILFKTTLIHIYEGIYFTTKTSIKFCLYLNLLNLTKKNMI